MLLLVWEYMNYDLIFIPHKSVDDSNKLNTYTVNVGQKVLNNQH